MAYRIEGKDIVIDGWENGISDNPYKGINAMSGVNIISVPGETSVAFAQTPIIFQPLSLTVTSANAATNVVTATINTGSLDTVNNGQCITFSGGSLPAGGVVAGKFYWIQASSPTTFQIFSDFGMNNLVDITATFTASGSSVDMSEIRYFEKNFPYGVDITGKVWASFQANNYYWVYLGNTTSAINDITNGNGICMYTASNLNQYLFVFRNGGIDYLNINTGAWVYEWNPLKAGGPGSDPGIQTLNTGFGVNNPHEAQVFLNRYMYICDGNYIDYLAEIPGQNFDPTNAATFIWSKTGLPLPKDEVAQCLEVLGQNLLIGGTKNYVYTWDTLSSFYGLIYIAENGVYKMVTVNTNTYLFAGKRGRIYYTNGSQAQFFQKVPDHLSGGIEPIYTWKGVAYSRNQLYFGVSVTKNDGSALTSYSGLWACDITTNAMRVVTQQSTANSTVTAIYSNPNTTSGYSLFVAWKNGSNYGIDTATSDPWGTYNSYIIADLIPLGQILTKRTLTNVEFKLSAPLVSGEGIKISYRTNLTGSFTPLGETTTAGVISDYYLNTLDQFQWVQLKIELKSTATNPSYARLVEVRLR